jgi:hypothetical protein
VNYEGKKVFILCLTGKYHHRGELILEEEDQGYHQQQQNSRIEKEKNEAKVMMLSSALNYNKEIL